MQKLETLKLNNIYQGKAEEVLQTFPDECVDTIITSPPYWCYDKETEVLTYDGWKNITNIKINEKVLTLKPENLEVEWKKVVATNVQFYEGKMIKFLNKFVDLIVTPAHKMFVFNKDNHPIRQRDPNNYHKYLKETYLIDAKKIKSGHVTAKTGFIWKGKEKKHFILPSLETIYNRQHKIFPEIKIKMEHWLSFFGLYIAEGSARGTKGSKRKNYEISIKQKKPNDEKVRKIFQKLPFKFNEYIGKNDVVCFSISNKQLWSYLKQFGNSHEKFIPKEIKEFSTRLLNILMKWYLFGDGCYRKKGKGIEVTCFTVSQKLQDDISEIAIKIGSNISIRSDNVMCFLKRKTVKLWYCKSQINFRDFVYGLEVESNHIICVRRNNKIVFSGNSLRDYGDKDQLGLEDTLEEYLEKCLFITAELKRVLKPKGVMFWVHGNSYSGNSGKKQGWSDRTGMTSYNNKEARKMGITFDFHPTYSITRKCLTNQNHRLAILMQDKQGWVQRNNIVWSKSNYLPSGSVRDRFTNSHEAVFMFSKNPKYYFDVESIRVPYAESGLKRKKYLHTLLNSDPSCKEAKGTKGLKQGAKPKTVKPNKNGKKPFDVVSFDEENELSNFLGFVLKEDSSLIDKYLNFITKNNQPTDFWTISPASGTKEKHYAVFPLALIESMFKGTCPSRVCKECGKPRERIVKKVEESKSQTELDKERGEYAKHQLGLKKPPNSDDWKSEWITLGWTNCNCKKGWKPGVVLDCFMGQGTTALIARIYKRNFVGIELNQEYIEIAKKRLKPANIEKEKKKLLKKKTVEKKADFYGNQSRLSSFIQEVT